MYQSGENITELTVVPGPGGENITELSVVPEQINITELTVVTEQRKYYRANSCDRAEKIL